MTVLGVIQCRLDSTRFPGKSLAPLLGVPMVARIHERLTCAKRVDRICIATSDEPSDAPIVAMALERGIDVYAGSKLDLADRIHGAAETYGADAVVLITGDCPLVDPGLVDSAIGMLDEADCEIVSNMQRYTFPDGLDTTVLSRVVIDRVWRDLADPFWREWVLAHMIIEHPEDYGVCALTHDPDLSSMRWTVDYPEDLAFVEQVYRELYPASPAFGMDDVLDLVSRRPDLAEINAHHALNEGYMTAKDEAGK
jgi:spore coat polysaccharide biosynthesis protein SpsF